MIAFSDTVDFRQRAFPRESLFYFALMMVLLAGVFLIERLFPIAYVHLISEDRIGEYSTAVAFLAAGGIFIASGIRSAGINRAFLLCLACFSVLVAGEEISWGQRIFGIDTPEILRNVNHQGETTLHNIGPLQTASFHEVAGVLLLVLMMVSTARGPLSRRFNWLGELSLPSPSLWPAAAVASCVLLTMPMVKGDEISEMLLGFVVLMWSLLVAYEMSVIEKFRRNRELVISGALIASVVAGAFFAVVFGGDMGWRYNITASRDYPNAGMMQQSRILFDHIMRQPEMIQPDTLENFHRLHD